LNLTEKLMNYLDSENIQLFFLLFFPGLIFYFSLLLAYKKAPSANNH